MSTPITEKQIQQLQRGAALHIHGTFRRMFSDGDIGIDIKETNIHTDEPRNYLISVHPSCVFLPSEPPTSVGSYPKFRRFRKGDKVRIIAWNGRRPFDTHHGLPLNPGEVHIVLDDEYERNEVYIGMSSADEEQSVVHACNLELITPIEEQDPYGIAENIYGWIVFKDTPGNVMANFNNIHPHAKEAAEAERDRLNAEHRKEQA